MIKFYQQNRFHILFWLIYLLWIVLFVSVYQYVENIGLTIVLGFIVSVIIHIFWAGLEIKASKKTITNLDAIEQDIKENKLHKIYYYLIINRSYIFPILLVVYLIYLLIKQTQIRNLHHTLFFVLLRENLLLILVLISGITTIFKENKDKIYQKEILSKKSSYISLWLSVILSILGWYIIYIQTINIWAISIAISSIAWVLIFLIWVLIIEEDNDKPNQEIDEKK